MTSYAAQGKTVDRVVVVRTVRTAESFPASGRESVTVFTDDAIGLRRAVGRTDPRTSATELLGPSAAHPAWAAWLGRRAAGVRRSAGAVFGGADAGRPVRARQQGVVR